MLILLIYYILNIVIIVLIYSNRIAPSKCRNTAYGAKPTRSTIHCSDVDNNIIN